MKLMAERDNYACVLLEENDFDIFKIGFDSVCDEKESWDPELVEKIKASNYEMLQFFFEDPDVDHLILIEHGEDDSKVIIGDTSIMYGENKAELEDLFISKSHRNKGLADLLYEGMLQQVVEKKPHLHYATLGINDWNTSSIKAAERNGFRATQEDKENGGFIPFSRKLDDIKKPDFTNDYEL